MRNECQFVLVRRQHSRQWDGGITDNVVMAGEIHDRDTRLSHSNDVHIPPHNTDILKRSFIFNGGVIWNKLPDEIGMANDVLDLNGDASNLFQILYLKMQRANDTILKGCKMHDEHYFKYWLIILSIKRLRIIGGVHLRFKRCMLSIWFVLFHILPNMLASCSFYLDYFVRICHIFVYVCMYVCMYVCVTGQHGRTILLLNVLPCINIFEK